VKRLFALIAVLGIFAAAPVFAQQIETLPSGKKVKIVEKEDGTVIILPVEKDSESKIEKKTIKKIEKDAKKEYEDSELEDDFDGDLPKEVKDLLKRVRDEVERHKSDGDQPRVKIVPWGDGKDMPEEMRKAVEEMRKKMEQFRKDAEQRFEKMRKEMEEKVGKARKKAEKNDDGDTEVEEYTKEAPDGSWKIHVKIVRKTSKSHSESHSESAPETPQPKKQDSERKQ
jgi:hypothetical protein